MRPAARYRGRRFTALRIDAHHGEIVAATGENKFRRRHDLAIALDGNRRPFLEDAAEVQNQRSIAVETRVQAAVAVVAQQRKVAVAAANRGADRHDLAVGLKCNALGQVEIIDAEIGPGPADESKGRLRRCCAARGRRR